MQKLTFTLLFSVFTTLFSLANNVIVKGTVKYSNGAPAANQTVWIYTDSLTSPAGCTQFKVVQTNPNGVYIDSLQCTGTITKVRIMVLDCDSNYKVENVQVNTISNLVEKNFLICPPRPTCEAKFSYTLQQMSAVFTSLSQPSTGSTITGWHWSFGDGTGGSGANITHHYANAGTYTVKLKIETSSGCTDSMSKSVTIYNTSGGCSAKFRDSMVTSNKFYFFSASSYTNTGDSIVKRIWSFGDGYVNNGNQVVADHIYQKNGTYTVCLKIVSSKGCIDSTCKVITVKMPDTIGCRARFTYENLPFNTPPHRKVKFNSGTSESAAGDSIISRKWTFGDGSSLSGNEISPTHAYQSPGTYNVCLIIKTKSGCEQSYCKQVIVTNNPGACVPHFSWKRTGAKQVTFNSNNSWVAVGDTIVQRKWNFGDGSPILSGNVVAPVHDYSRSGIYTVSLRIITKNKCEQTFTVPVAVQDSTLAPPNQDIIHIVSIYPNPAQAQTQTVISSRQDNVQAELSIYDVYGTKKWTMSKLLMKGDNMTVVPTAMLLPGPYYFRVTTVYGVKSKPFFKR